MFYRSPNCLNCKRSLYCWCVNRLAVCGIRDDVMHIISSWAAANTVTATLDLWGNHLRAPGVSMLLHSLHTAALTSLNIGCCDIGPSGAVALGTCMPSASKYYATFQNMCVCVCASKGVLLLANSFTASLPMYRYSQARGPCSTPGYLCFGPI